MLIAHGHPRPDDEPARARYRDGNAHNHQLSNLYWEKTTDVLAYEVERAASLGETLEFRQLANYSNYWFGSDGRVWSNTWHGWMRGYTLPTVRKFQLCPDSGVPTKAAHGEWIWCAFHPDTEPQPALRRRLVSGWQSAQLPTRQFTIKAIEQMSPSPRILPASLSTHVRLGMDRSTNRLEYPHSINRSYKRRSRTRSRTTNCKSNSIGDAYGQLNQLKSVEAQLARSSLPTLLKSRQYCESEFIDPDSERDGREFIHDR